MCRNTFDPWNSEDPAVRARARGRAITEHIARLIEANDRGSYWVDFRSILSGNPARYNPLAGEPSPGDNSLIPETAPHFGSLDEAIRHVWATHIDPAYGWNDPIKVDRGE